MPSATRPASRAATIPRMMRGSAGRTKGRRRIRVRAVPARQGRETEEGLGMRTWCRPGGRAAFEPKPVSDASKAQWKK